jgi:hypothetical protein
MVPSAAAPTSTNREQATMKLKPQADYYSPCVAVDNGGILVVAADTDDRGGEQEVGDAPRRFWFCAVYILPLCIGVASLLAYDFHRNDHIFPRSAPWQPTAVVAWGVHMALVMELFFFMSLYPPAENLPPVPNPFTLGFGTGTIESGLNVSIWCLLGKKMHMWRFEPKTSHFSPCTCYHLNSHHIFNLDKICSPFKFTLGTPLVPV